MLKIRINSKGYLMVIEELLSFNTTKIYYWYYDIVKWEKNALGKKGETPSLPMSTGDIQWVKEHYLSKVGNYAQSV